jgi:hypothetical protein
MRCHRPMSSTNHDLATRRGSRARQYS